MSTTNRVSYHLRTGYGRVACNTRLARTYMVAERFDALPVEHRCAKCDAKRTAAKAREAAKAEAS